MEFFISVACLLSFFALRSSIRTKRRQTELEEMTAHWKSEIERLKRICFDLQRDFPGKKNSAGAPVGEQAPTEPPPAPERVPGTPPADQAPEKPSPAPAPVPAAVFSGPPRPQPQRETPPPPPGPSALARIDWEGLVGVKLFSWIAGIALVIAAVFFLRYSIDQGWLTPSVRMAIGIFVGTTLLVGCERKAARKYSVTANALDAAGIAILFSTFFASHALWKILDTIPTFGFMVLVTVIAVLLSIRRDSVFIALLGLIGGFSTPALLSTGENNPFGLFGYLLIINAGLAWVGYRKKWPHLTVLALIFTTLYQWGWVVKFLDVGQLLIAIAVFLIFPAVNTVAFMMGTRREPGSGKRTIFEKSAVVGAALPLAFAVYMAAIPAYGPRFGLLFGFLLLLDLGLAAIAIARSHESLHLGGAVSTLIVFAIWLSRSYPAAAWPGILGFISAFVILYACAPIVASKMKRPFLLTAGNASLAAPALLFSFAVLAGREPATASPWILFGVLFFLLAVLAWVAVTREQGTLYFLGAIFALATEAVWSTKYLVPERLVSSLAIYAGFALFYLGVPLAARLRGQELRPRGGGSATLILSLGLLLFLAAGPVAQIALWGLALLLMLLNLGLFLEEEILRRPLPAVVGIVFSWIVIAVWWATATVSAILVPALLLVSGFALLVLGGNIWLMKRAKRNVPFVNQGIFLALAGHLFLVFVALRPDLSIPPWPFLAVLAVLDLAIGVASFYSRRAELHVAAVCASQVILSIWALAVKSPVWLDVSIYGSAGLALFAIGWLFLARHLGLEKNPGSFFERFEAAPVLALFLAQINALLVLALAPRIGLAILIPAFAAFVSALLWMAFLSGREWAAVLGVVLPAIAVSAWQAGHPGLWKGALLFAAVPYALFTAYPLVLGGRIKKRIEPHLTALLAGVAFFFLARRAIISGGYEDRIGILPVGQALVAALLLWRLLKTESPAERHMGRLALVAGAALAFITVAIPLQLEKQWITIGWALQAAALAWLYGRIPHRGLFWWCSGLFTAVFARLVLNPAVLAYHPRGGLPILNWYFYAYLLAAATFFSGARFLWKTNERIEDIRFSHLLPGAGAVLLFLLLNIEIADFFSSGSNLTFNFSAGLSQDLTYTIGWGLYAIGLLVAGIIARSRVVRMASILLLVVTVGKCFMHDLWRLGGLFRIGSFVGLALCLAVVAVFIQKFVLAGKGKTP
jgi:uncharacterized membrane protein